MMGITRLVSGLTRLAKNEGGSHTMELALAISLFALVAGFGFFALGDAISDFFNALGQPFRDAF